MKRYMIINHDKMRLTGEPVYVVLEYPAPDGEFVKVSELRELLDKARNDITIPAGGQLFAEWLLAKLNSSPRASPAGEGLKEKVTK